MLFAACLLPAATVLYLNVLAAVRWDVPGWPLAEALSAGVRGLEELRPRFSQVLVLVNFLVRPLLLVAAMVLVVKWGSDRGRRLLPALCVGLLAAELVFGFVPRSHGWTSLARINWHIYFQRHNELGFRDVGDKDPGRTKLFVLGDSFTEGSGIRDVADRFDQVLRRRLDPRVEVYNLGRAGSQTIHQLDILRDYPEPPEIVVLQYFGNDILATAAQEAIAPHCQRPLVLRHPQLVAFSSLVNFAVNLPSQREFLQCTYAAIAGVYRDREHRALHFGDLVTIHSYCEERGIDFIVLIVPYLDDLAASRVFVDPVRRLFERRGVPVVDVSELVRDLPPHRRIVNRNDLHASEIVHERMGVRLAEVIAPRLEEPAGPP